MLVTVGLGLARHGADPGDLDADRPGLRAPRTGSVDTTTVGGAHIPNDRWLEIALAVVVLVGLLAFLRYTRYGLIVRAASRTARWSPRSASTSARRSRSSSRSAASLAALAGVLSGVYFGSVDPLQGTRLLIFAFIVVVIGGLGSLGGSAVAAVVVGLLQQYANYYGSQHGLLGGDLVGDAPARGRAARPPGRPRRRAPRRGPDEADRASSPLAVLGLAIACPGSPSALPGSSPGRSNSPGTLQLLALCLIFGGVAMTYDLLFGHTGLLSFGHALYFAVGVYLVAIATTKWDWGFWQAILFTAAVGLVLPLVLGSISLRVGGIAFAMVTLAFAQAGSILVGRTRTSGQAPRRASPSPTRSSDGSSAC